MCFGWKGFELGGLGKRISTLLTCLEQNNKNAFIRAQHIVPCLLLQAALGKRKVQRYFRAKATQSRKS